MLCFPDNGTVLKQAGRQTTANSYHDEKKKKKEGTSEYGSGWNAREDT